MPAFPRRKLVVTDSEIAGIKLDGLGYYGASSVQPQSAMTPLALVMKQHGATFAQDGSTPANFEQLQAEAKLQGVTTVKAWLCAGGCSPSNLAVVKTNRSANLRRETSHRT